MKNMPLIAKILIAGIPILCIGIWIIYIQVNGEKLKKKNYASPISSTVVMFTSYYGRSSEFRLENGIKLYFMPPVGDKILIGDSIKKDPNTYLYKVCRKDSNGIYKLWATYSLDRVH